MAWTQEKIDEVYQKAQQSAVTDEEFREELLKNPNEVIARLAGEELPEDFRVRVIENDPQYAATFVLPPMVSGELTDEEMAQVAGGACGVAGCCAAKACAAEGTATPCGAYGAK